MGSSNVPLRLGYRIIDGLGTLCQIARVVSEWPPKIPTILPNFQCTCLTPKIPQYIPIFTCLQSETTCKFSTMTAAVDNRCWWKKWKVLNSSVIRSEREDESTSWVSRYTWLDWTAQIWSCFFELCRTQCVLKETAWFCAWLSNSPNMQLGQLECIS